MSWMSKLWNRKPPSPAPVGKQVMYCDIFDSMDYNPSPLFCLADRLPIVVGFRVKPILKTPDPRPSFAFLENDKELEAWHMVFTGPAEHADDATHVSMRKWLLADQRRSDAIQTSETFSDLPLLRWNSLPSTLPELMGLIVQGKYMPAENGWPELGVQICSGDMARSEAARGRYHFEQDEASYLVV